MGMRNRESLRHLIPEQVLKESEFDRWGRGGEIIPGQSEIAQGILGALCGSELQDFRKVKGLGEWVW